LKTAAPSISPQAAQGAPDRNEPPHKKQDISSNIKAGICKSISVHNIGTKNYRQGLRRARLIPDKPSNDRVTSPHHQTSTTYAEEQLCSRENKFNIYTNPKERAPSEQRH